VSRVVATVYVHEFHGGIHDGLVMGNHLLFQEVLLPRDIQISTEADYQAWMPQLGDVVLAYRYQGPPRKPEGSKMFHHHLYLHGSPSRLIERKAKP